MNFKSGPVGWGSQTFVCNFVMTLSLYNCGNCGLVCRLSNMTSENFTHNFIYYCFASLTNLCNISLLQYLSVPWPLEGGRPGISRIIQPSSSSTSLLLGQSQPSPEWTIGLYYSLGVFPQRLTLRKLRKIKRNKQTDRLDFLDIVSGCLCFRKCFFSSLKQFEKMFIFRDSYGATTNFLEKLVIFRDSHAKSDHFPDIQKDSRITSSDLQSN